MKRLAPLVAAVLLAGCSVKSTVTELLPWLRHRATYSGFGGFGGSTENEYFFRYFGLWWKLDATFVRAVDADHALATRGREVVMVHRGRWKPVPICSGHVHHAIPRIPPAAVDCMRYATFASTAPYAPATAVTITRVGPEGETLGEWRVAVDGAARVFPPGTLMRYYDDRGMPYLLASNPAAARDHRAMPRDCALATPGAAGSTTLIEGPPSMDYRECDRREAWEAIVGRPLREAHERTTTWPKGPR